MIQKTHLELETEINKVANSFHYINEISNTELIYKLQNCIDSFLKIRKVYDFRVKGNYPEVEIYIQYHKAGEIMQIYPLRFERLKKLRKLKEIYD